MTTSSSIGPLEWKASKYFIGWNAIIDEDKPEYLKVIYFPGGIWRLWHHNFDFDGEDELLGEFPTDDAAKAFAKTWIGDDE